MFKTVALFLIACWLFVYSETQAQSVSSIQLKSPDTKPLPSPSRQTSCTAEDTVIPLQPKGTRLVFKGQWLDVDNSNLLGKRWYMQYWRARYCQQMLFSPLAQGMAIIK